MRFFKIQSDTTVTLVYTNFNKKKRRCRMFLARRELWFFKGRFILIGLIILLVSWLVFILSGLGNGLSDLGAATVRYSDMDAVVFQEDAEFSLTKSILPEDLVPKIEELSGVEAAAIGTSPASIVLGNSPDDSSKKTSVMLSGITKGSFLEPETISGNGLDIEDPNKVIVNDTLADEGFSIGDTIAIPGTDIVLEINGFAENETLNHLPVIYMPMNTFRDFKYAVPGSDMGIKDPINAVFVKNSDLTNEELANKIDGIEIATKKETLNAIPGYQAENATISMMLGFLILISAVVIAVFFYVLTTQKVQQFGVMKAIGASNGFVIGLVISQVFLLSSISILCGIGLTFLTAAILPEGMPFNLLPNLVLNYSLILLAISLLGSLFSVRKIIKIDPLTALGRAE